MREAAAVEAVQRTGGPHGRFRRPGLSGPRRRRLRRKRLLRRRGMRYGRFRVGLLENSATGRLGVPWQGVFRLKAVLQTEPKQPDYYVTRPRRRGKYAIRRACCSAPIQSLPPLSSEFPLRLPTLPIIAPYRSRVAGPHTEFGLPAMVSLRVFTTATIEPAPQSLLRNVGRASSAEARPSSTDHRRTGRTQWKTWRES